MAYTENCRGCMYENACDYIDCRTEKTCKNCKYEHKDSESIYCCHCTYNATDNFVPKENNVITYTEEELKLHDKEVKDKAVNDFADWCYMHGIDFSYMGKKARTFCKEVIDNFNTEQ